MAECLGKTADIAAYAENRELIYGALTAMGYRCARPDGAFYLFLKSPEPDSRAFCRRAMDYDILLVPGDDFGCPGYARLAYCVARSQIERSLPGVPEAGRELRALQVISADERRPRGSGAPLLRGWSQAYMAFAAM